MIYDGEPFDDMPWWGVLFILLALAVLFPFYWIGDQLRKLRR